MAEGAPGPAAPAMSATPATSATSTTTGTVLQGGRAKAYRPMPPADRASAFDAGLAAYDRGDYFLAHELLEPAWMGTADIGERELYQGLIKLAAAYVHDVRGNPPGLAKNLSGARALLASAHDAGFDGGLDLADLIASIDRRLAAPEADAEAPTLKRSTR